MHLVAGDKANIVPETIVAGPIPEQNEEIPVKFNTVQEAEKTELQFREWKRSVACKEMDRRVKPRTLQPHIPGPNWANMGEYYEKVIEYCEEKIETSTPDIRESYMRKKARLQKKLEEFREQETQAQKRARHRLHHYQTRTSRRAIHLWMQTMMRICQIRLQVELPEVVTGRWITRHP